MTTVWIHLLSTSSVHRRGIVIADVDYETLADICSSRNAKLTAKSSRVNVAVTPEQESTEHWLGQKIQDTVEDGLRVW